MKIRQGFVSNSSSSSFCIFGIYLNENNYEDVCELEKKIEEEGLEMKYTPSDDIVVGRSYSTIKDDETGLQFKESVKEKLKKLNLPSNMAALCEEAWYDG
jgi:hypothetical protein